MPMTMITAETPNHHLPVADEVEGRLAAVEPEEDVGALGSGRLGLLEFGGELELLLEGLLELGRRRRRLGSVPSRRLVRGSCGPPSSRIPRPLATPMLLASVALRLRPSRITNGRVKK